MSAPLVRDVMTSPVITVTPDTTVSEIARLLTTRRISGVPVVDDGKVIGMVSEGDLLWKEGTLHAPIYVTLLDAIIPIGGPHFDEELRKAAGTTAKDVMTSPVIGIVPDADVTVAASRMLDHKINRLPVIDGHGHLLGIVARADLIRSLTGPAG
ncbi:MAG: CBS domain-containing protein [Candidatus Sericytochromatia bacterium]|nr:CBS domain-containing protein [Candidatus Sericytochromatia bacterium]